MAAATEIEAQKVEGTRNVEAFIKTRLAKVQKDIEGVGAKWKGQVEGVGARWKGQVEDLRKSLATAPQQVLAKVKSSLGDARYDKLVKLAVSPSAAVSRLADAGTIKDAFAGLQKRLEGLKVRVESLVKRGATAPEAGVAEPKATDKE